jgi:hypothetical protein
MSIRRLMFSILASTVMIGGYSQMMVAEDAGGSSEQIVLSCNTDGTYTCGNTCGATDCERGWCCSTDGC